MQQAPRVVITIAALVLGLALAAPAGAANRIALVGCDLTAIDGPTATFLQISGGSDQGHGGSAFATESNDSLSSNDVLGRSCARVMADLVDDGFTFQSAEVSGGRVNQWLSIWQASN